MNQPLPLQHRHTHTHIHRDNFGLPKFKELSIVWGVVLLPVCFLVTFINFLGISPSPVHVGFPADLKTGLYMVIRNTSLLGTAQELSGINRKGKKSLPLLFQFTLCVHFFKTGIFCFPFINQTANMTYFLIKEFLMILFP